MAFLMTHKYFKVIIDTEQYSGNFEREMFSFITGLQNPRQDGIEEYCAKNIVNLEWWEDHSIEEDDDEYGPQQMGIQVTPNWFNNGMGKHKRADDPDISNFKHKCPAYLSVGIFVDEVPPENVIKEIKKRAKEFCDFYGNILVASNANIGTKAGDRLTYTGLRIVEVVGKRKQKETAVYEDLVS